MAKAWGRPKFYILKDRKPEPVDSVLDWARGFNFDSRKVASDIVGDVHVSTIFLGVDHNWREGPPLLFETMIFGGSLDIHMDRCSTWEDAEIMHTTAIKLVRGTLQ